MKKTNKLVLFVSTTLIILLTIIFIKKLVVSQSNTRKHQSSYIVKRVYNTDDLVESGKVFADDTRQLKNPNGKIIEMTVSDGDYVDKGEILLTVYDQGVQEKLKEIKNSILTAQQSLNVSITANNKLIKKQKLATDQATLETLQEAIDKNKNDITNQTRSLNDQQEKSSTLQNEVYKNLLAPFSGTLSVEKDEKSGDPVITIYSERRHVKSSVTEFEYSKVTNTHFTKVTSIATDKVQKSTIRHLSQIPSNTDKQNITTYSFTVPVDKRFRYGESVRLNIPQNEIRVASKSVVISGKRLFIWQVGNSKSIVHLQPVKGTKKNGIYVLTGGIKSGTKIITNPDKLLKSGMRIIK